MKKKITLNANNFSDLEGFYHEVEKHFTNNLDWKIGRNLDAFNDVLRGGFGVHKYGEPVDLHWINSAKSKQDLGLTETIKYLEKQLTTCHPDNIPYGEEELQEVKAGRGKLLYDTIIEIIRDHEHIELTLE